MTIVKVILASAAAIIITSSAAFAQQNQTTGRIINIDKAGGKITLQHKQGGTVGTGGAKDLVDTYKIQDGLTCLARLVSLPLGF